MEAILLCLWIIICRLIGIDIASKLGSIVFKFIGPMTKFDKRAANNISKIYPKLDNGEYKKLKRDTDEIVGRINGKFRKKYRRICICKKIKSL